MSLPDDLLLTRHVTAFMNGDFPPEKLAVSSPEIMAKIEPFFQGYVFSPSTAFIDLRIKVESLLHLEDPMDIIDKGSRNQSDEYLPEADLVIWLYLQKKFNSETFWALWEYQFADLNPFSNPSDAKLNELLMKIQSLLS
jgi:hypothetical protein